jgi:hypothetical protein
LDAGIVHIVLDGRPFFDGLYGGQSKDLIELLSRQFGIEKSPPRHSMERAAQRLDLPPVEERA